MENRLEFKKFVRLAHQNGAQRGRGEEMKQNIENGKSIFISNIKLYKYV